MTNAKGWCGLFNGFAGKNTKKLSPIDLLPYPDEFKPKYRVSLATARIIMEVITDLKPSVVSAISGIMDEVLELTGNKSKH